MQVLRVLVLCLSAALICMTLRAAHPQMAAAVAMAAGVAALMLSSADLGAFSRALRTLEDYAQGEAQQLYLVKICGIAVIAEFASDICRDAGEGALAGAVELGGALAILYVSLPLFSAVLDLLETLMEG